MSAKKAKQIRKEIKYNPNADKPRSYIEAGNRRSKISGLAPIELDPTCKRVLYQEMKKEA